MSAKDPHRMTVVYTDGYAAPEQILGYPEPRSDVFSLAATLYHLATGKLPRGAETVDDIDALLNDPTKPIAPQDHWFFELLRINLAFSPDDRYCSVVEFKADLARRRVSTETVCGKCHSVNQVRQPYCRSCAAPLTPFGMPCRGCGKQNRMGCRWCIYCGRRPGG